MSDKISIAEFKALITDFADRYPLARVDFTYPHRHGGKATSRLGRIIEVRLLMARPGAEIVRFEIDVS